MKLINMIEREIKDYKVADKCNTCCLSCTKYKTVKEMKKQCEPRKARARITDRMMRGAIKKTKSCNMITGKC